MKCSWHRHRARRHDASDSWGDPKHWLLDDPLEVGLGGHVGDAPVQGLGPELRELSGVMGVKADCQYRDAQDVVSRLW